MCELFVGIRLLCRKLLKRSRCATTSALRILFSVMRPMLNRTRPVCSRYNRSSRRFAIGVVHRRRV